MPRESTVPWTQAPTLVTVTLGIFYSGLWIFVPSERPPIVNTGRRFFN